MIRVTRVVNPPSTRLSGWILPLSLIALPLILSLAAWSWRETRSLPVSDFLVEYAVDHEDGNPLNVIVEAPGHVWFTMPLANAIGSLIVTSTVDYRFDYFQVPTPSSAPYDLVFDPGRNFLWFTQQAGNKIAYYDLTGESFMEFSVPTDDSGPTGIALSPDDTIWFVEKHANQLAQFDPDSENFLEFPYPLDGGDLEDIAVANSNTIWFTAPGVKRLARFFAGGSSFLSIPVNSGPGTPMFPALNVAIRSDARPLVTAPENDRIGLLVPGTTTLWRWYRLPGASTQVSGLTYTQADGKHQIWYTENGTGIAGFFVTDLTGKIIDARRHGLSSDNTGPIGIAVDDHGQAWIAESEGQAIASWRPPYSYNSFIPALSH